MMGCRKAEPFKADLNGNWLTIKSTDAKAHRTRDLQINLVLKNIATGKANGITFEKDYDTGNKEIWEEMTDYLVAKMIRFEKALKPHLPIVREALIKKYKLNQYKNEK